MRYNLHRPVSPVDPRKLEIESYAHLDELLPVFAECDLEEEAADVVFQIFPSGIAMPVPVKVGSGSIVMLGIIDGASTTEQAQQNPTATIPFSLLVRAMPENIADRKRIQSATQFARTIWKAPVMEPLQPTHRAVEVRGFFLENPVLVAAKIGRHRDGRLVIRCEINGQAFSLAFEAPAILSFDQPERSITSG